MLTLFDSGLSPLPSRPVCPVDRPLKERSPLGWWARRFVVLRWFFCVADFGLDVGCFYAEEFGSDVGCFLVVAVMTVSVLLRLDRTLF